MPNDTVCPNPSGLCQCGCGGRTKNARDDRPVYGHVAGLPLRFIHGHNNRKPVSAAVLDRRCGCGCGQLPPPATTTNHKNGLIKGLPCRFMPGHGAAAHARTRTMADRFWPKVHIGAPEECWEWARCRDALGYGRFGIPAGGVAGAHRVAWELTRGLIPDDLQVCHRCDNPPCCNPNHLFLGTAANNGSDRNVKGRARGAARTIADETVYKISQMAQNGIQQAIIAKLTNVEQSTISRIVGKKRQFRWR